MSITYGGDNITFPDGSTQNTSPQTGFTNRIINGSMVIDQRNAGASVNGDSKYPVDRWSQFVAGNFFSLTSQQSTTAPAGFTNSIVFTATTAGTATSGQYAFFVQPIEGFNVADLGWGTANAQPVTVGFWVRSSLTGTFSGSLKNSAESRSYPFTFTISAANTFEYKTVTVLGDTSGTWLTNNGVGIRLCFDLGTGSTRRGTAGAWAAANYDGATGSVSFSQTLAATFYITGVSLVKCSTALPWEFRSIGQELALCQRYYETSWTTQVGVNGAGVSSTGWYGLNGSDGQLFFTWRVNKRTSPTINVYAPLATPAINNIRQANNGTIVGISSISAFGNTATVANAGTANVHFQLGWEASAEL